LRAEYREDAEQTQRLLNTIESLTQQVAEITADNKELQQTIDELLKQI
jgi:prefoldin subunit 5